jgi:hypothetical protein
VPSDRTRSGRELYQRVSDCRACGSARLEPVISFGATPLADRLLTADQLHLPELLIPLDVVVCASCSLMQIVQTVSPPVLFGQDYPYYSSVSQSLLRHASDHAADLIRRLRLDAHSQVIEVASNDGYLLRNFVSAGIPALGVDPASGPAGAALRAGVPTLCTFFDPSLARSLERQSVTADLVIANNVLAHVADLDGFVEALGTVLKESGLVSVQVPYVVDLVDKCQFPTIYHQHLCYFSLKVLDRLFRKHSLFVNDVQHLPIQGGSLRLSVQRREEVRDSVRQMLAEEARRSIGQPEYYRAFATRIAQVRKDLMALLQQLTDQGNQVAAYGAAGKATTLLAYCGLGPELLEYVVDLDENKQGKHMGGNHLSIFSPSRLLDDMPGYVLLLVWNLADEVLGQQAEYLKRGGKFIVPIPQPKVV